MSKHFVHVAVVALGLFVTSAGAETLKLPDNLAGFSSDAGSNRLREPPPEGTAEAIVNLKLPDSSYTWLL